MFGGTVVICLAVVAGVSSPAGASSEPSSKAEDAANSFLADSAALCTDIVNQRSFEISDTATAAGLDLLTFAIDPPTPDAEPTADELGGWVDAMEPQLDELTETQEQLAELQDEADGIGPEVGLAWSQVVLTGAQAAAALSARIALLGGDEIWASIAAAIEPLPTSTPPPDAIAKLGMLLRDCAVVFTHPGVPDAYRDFIAPAATACSTAVTRRLANGYFDDETTLFDAGYALSDGKDVELTDELAAVVGRRVGEHEATLDDFASINVDAVPDAGAWQTRLDYEQALVDYYTGIAQALAGGDPVAVADAFHVVMDVPVQPDPLDALFLNQRDCQLLYSATDPVIGGGIAPVVSVP